MEVEETTGFSEDSLPSLTAGDILTCSTSVHMKKKPLNTQTGAPANSRPGLCGKKKVSIPLKKLREVSPPPCLPEVLTLTKDDTGFIPPALLANKSTFHTSSATTSGREIEGVVSKCKERHSEQLPSHKKDRQLSKAFPHEDAGNAHSQMKQYSSKQKGADIFISQYDAGQKEAVRAVFKQRVQNAPVFKEVKVQLLDNVCPDQKDNTKSTHSEVDSVTTIAAATVAAIASTAPLLKVQSDLEAKVSSVSEVLNKLQETDRKLQRVAEQQHLEKPSCHQRACELEKQMNLFMEQRIQHLENLQQQQINIQSHLISSALNSGGISAPSNESAKHATKAGRSLGSQTSPPQKDLFPSSTVHMQAFPRHFGNQSLHRQKSSLKTPAPRRYAPVPVAKDAKISQKITKREQSMGEKENICQPPYGGTLGGGKLLEQILNSQEASLNQEAALWKEPTDGNAVLRPYERQYRSSIFQTEPIHAFENTNQDTNPVERTVKKADDVLRDLGQLKREMCDILQDAKEWKADMNGFMKTTSHFKEPIQVKDHLPSCLPVHSLGLSSDTLNHVPSKTEQKDPAVPSLSELQLLSKSSIQQSTKASRTILWEAEKILRAVRKNKKLLEENLEAIIRAKDGNTLNTFIDELTADRDVLEEIRIRKAVDEWIKTISLEIQDERAKKDALKTQQMAKIVKPSRQPNGRFQYPLGIPARRPLSVARPSRKLADLVPLKTRMEVHKEDYISQVYGKPVYQGHRTTLKKSPYLRFNSPPPKSKPPRPKLIESVRGTKVKSARTQTNPYISGSISSLEKPHPGSASHQELQYLFSPIKEASESGLGPLEGHLIPMAVPLGQKQINNILPHPEGISLGGFHPVTVTTSIPPSPSPQKPQLKFKKPNIAVIEMKSEKKDPPKLTMQMLPSVDIDSVSSNHASVNQVSLTSVPRMLQASPEGSLLQDDEELKLPGADFVDITDVTQDKDDDDGIPELFEPVLEFNRHQERVSPKYNGPPFPPAVPPVQHSTDILEEIIEKRETLENKLVGWVEQEVMARIISEMYPTQKETVHHRSLSESDESQAVSSDIVEAAGASGFQLFVDAGVPVDSEMIRRFVNEAVAETVAVMLGDRENQKATSATGLPSITRPLPEKETILSTPLVTPETTPPPSPLPSKEPLRVKTPESSPSVTEMDERIAEQQVTAAGSKADIISPVDTPLATPVATPPVTAPPSPPHSEWPPDGQTTERLIPPNAWGDVELPLDEEKPSPQNEEGGYHPRAVIMSVARHEEPDSLVLPGFVGTEHRDLPSQQPRTPSLSVHSPSSGPSTEESSLSTTETEAADRPISEGEVLYSYGQLLAAKALAEGGLSVPNLSDSLTSSLRDAHEMDYDPPSEGQVLQRPHGGYHRDPILSLFSKLNQAPLASQEDICGSEYADDSAGELSEGQRPRLSKTAESILMGCSVYISQPGNHVSSQLTQQPASPGHCSRDAGEVLGDVNVTCGPMSMTELDRPVSPASYGERELASHPDKTTLEKQKGTVQAGPAKSRVIRVKPKSELVQQQDFLGDTDQTQIEPNMYLTSLTPGEVMPHLSSLPGPAKMSVKVPSADIDDEIQSFSSIHGSSDSSGADTL